MLEVVAALIRNNDNLLICQRPAHKARPLLWEFPGGKVELGETKEQALARECAEELAVELEVGTEVHSLTYSYSDVEVCLTFFDACIKQGEPQKLEHADIKWVTLGELGNYDFCPADAELIAMLAN